MDHQRAAAVAAQFTQAGTSLLLSMVAVRVLDPAEFGQYLLVASTIVIATGATTGLVGDSLTVLDRHDPALRRTLQRAALVCAVLAGVLVMLIAGLLGWLAWGAAAIAAAATAAFVLEDLVRRILMANRRFPAVVIVDIAYAIGALAVLAAAAVGGVGLSTLFSAIVVGQLLAMIVGVVLIPARDRYRTTMRGPVRTGALLGFGGWRAVHLTTGPVRIWVARLIVSGVAGFAAVGILEANRLVMAPLLLAVQGASSAVLVSQVALLRVSPARARKQADRDAALLSAATGVALVVVLVLREPLGHVMLGSTVLLDPWVLLGWGVVAVGAALNVPYVNLAVAAGATRAALAVRVVELCVVLLGMAALVLLLPASTWYLMVPLMMGLVGCAVAVAQRGLATWSTGHRGDPDQDVDPDRV